MELRDDRIYPATLRDVENQPLCIGKVLVRTVQSYAAFWPQLSVDHERLLKTAALLQIQEGPSFVMKRIQRCPSDAPQLRKNQTLPRLNAADLAAQLDRVDSPAQR
jgi:hypothetical protein